MVLEGNSRKMATLKVFSSMLLCSFLYVTCGSNIPTFIPQGYHLHLFPDIDTGVVKGQVLIYIAAFAEPTNVIELDADPSIIIHYKSIRVDEFKRDGSNRSNETMFEVTVVERSLFESGTLRMHLNRKLLRDITYKVHLDFQTSLKNDTNYPFYMRTFSDYESNMERKIIVMDLTKSGCYEAFPCFNKPDYKSWIALTVIRKSHMYALSTAPVNFTAEIPSVSGLVKDYFLNTPPMSMNSLALIVSDYRMINKLDTSNNFHSSRNVGRTFDSNTVKLILKRLEELLAMPFPLPSFDVVMVPKEAKIPYINGFGLIVLNGTSSYVNYQQLMDLILGACYQWFFHVATPVTSKSIIYSIIFNLRNIVADDVMKALKLNSMNKFNHGQLLFVNLEQTSTEKLLIPAGASEVIRTLSLNMLDRIFPGLLEETAHILLHKKQFKMYSDDDIWNAMNEASTTKQNFVGDPKLDSLEQIIKSWSNVEPIPLINVRRDYSNIRVNISQEPFIYSSYKHSLRKMKRNVTSYHPHWIPVIVSQPSHFFMDHDFIGWLSEKNQVFEINADPFDFIVVNPSHVGPYVVNYDEPNWRMLVENFSYLPTSVKLQLLADSMVLANVGLLGYDVFLNMSMTLTPNEEQLPLWLEYYQLALRLYKRLHAGFAEKYKTFISLQVGTLLTHLTDEILEQYPPPTQNLIKEMKYKMNCLTNRSSCFTFWEYQTLLHEAKMGRKLTGKHNCEIVQNVSLFDWQIIANGLFQILYSNNHTSSQKSRTLAILSCTEQPLAFETYMNLVLLNFNKSGIAITEKDQKYIIENLRYSQRPLLFNFLKKNFDMLKERLTKDVWATLIHAMIRVTRSVDDLDELLEFCAKFSNRFGGAEDVVTEGLIAVSTEVNWELEVLPNFENIVDLALKNLKKQ